MASWTYHKKGRLTRGCILKGVGLTSAFFFNSGISPQAWIKRDVHDHLGSRSYGVGGQSIHTTCSSDDFIKRRHLRCDPVYEYLFKFDIWLWYFLWMNCCVFDKVKCFFECLVCWPAVSDCWKGFIMLGIFDWCDAWYFYFNGVNFCHVISFDIVNVFFNICFKFWFGCFNFSSDSDYITRIFYPLFKWCGNCGNILLLFNYFWWKNYVVSFTTLVSF